MKDKKYIFIDFEFNNSQEKILNLVSCSYSHTEDMENFSPPTTYWLHNSDEEKTTCLKDLQRFFTQDYTFVVFGAEAEARSILSLGETEKHLYHYKFIDLWVEYRVLQNNNDDLSYGKQLIDGKEVKTKPPRPKWQRVEGEGAGQKPQGSLAAACYKLLGEKVDTDRKNKVRDIIISSPESFADSEAEEIMDYNESDIFLLPRLLEATVKEYKKLIPRRHLKTLMSEMLYRGEFSVRSAYMVHEGYPVNIEEMSGFSNSVPVIMNELCKDINSQFDFKPFRWSKKDFCFAWRQKDTRQFLREEYPDLIPQWLLTDSKDISLSLEAFTQHFDFKHTYPRGNFGAQIVRFLKVRQSLNGFSVKTNNSKEDKSIWSALGKDGRVRPFFNIYRSQSFRSQPSAKTFIFLKAAWMRALVSPPPGYVCFGIDWASQEFLIGALWSRDPAMVEAYESGDPYLWFGKASGKIPKDATKSHKLRDPFKSTTLAEMYLMGIESLAKKITNDSGIYYSIEEAEKLDEAFKDIFHVFCDARREAVDRYYDDKYLRLPDGTYMWGSNKNFRSIANCPIQGFGSAVMRKAVQLAQDKEVTIIKTLHDALYGICKIGELEEKIISLGQAMDEAFRFYFPPRLKPKASCRLDVNCWSPELTDSIWETKNGLVVKQQSVYVDKRSLSDYEKFKKYFNSGNLDL